MPFSLVSRLRRLFAFLANYGNPLHVLLRRRAGRGDAIMRVVDRRTGVAMKCRAAAHRMFGEVWFDHDYDVPAVPLRKGDVVIDVGANQGFFTCYAAHRGCRVLSFEPDSENFGLLRENVMANGYGDAVKLIRAAVKSSPGSTQLFRTAQLGGGMNTTNASFAQHFAHSGADAVQVEAVSLPELLRSEKIERVRLCKLDCEGAELEILESLTAGDAARIESFAIEYHPQAYVPLRLIDVIEAWGTHHVFAAGPKYCEREMLYAVLKSAFRAAPEFQKGA